MVINNNKSRCNAVKLTRPSAWEPAYLWSTVHKAGQPSQLEDGSNVEAAYRDHPASSSPLNLTRTTSPYTLCTCEQQKNAALHVPTPEAPAAQNTRKQSKNTAVRVPACSPQHLQQRGRHCMQAPIQPRNSSSTAELLQAVKEHCCQEPAYSSKQKPLLFLQAMKLHCYQALEKTATSPKNHTCSTQGA